LADDFSSLGTGTAAQSQKRYVDEDPALPFKTRAFKMTVVMDSRKLPEFLDELTNSSWPVTGLRVHQQQVFSDPFAQNGAAGAGGYEGGGGDDFGESFGGGSASSFQQSPLGQPGTGFGSSLDISSEGITLGGAGLGQGVIAQNYSHVANSAMQDRYLAQVVIGGLMTLYQPPQKEEGTDGADAQADQGESPQPVEPAQQPAEEAQPAAGQPVSPSSAEAAPADGNSESGTPAEPPGTTPATDENAKGELPAPANETSPNPEQAEPAVPKN
jgi:hypothetical protein